MAKDVSKLNYYEVMDLNPNSAHADSIRSRYIELRAFYNSPEVRTQGIFTDQELIGLQEILEEAYAVLGNVTLKAIYDEKINLRNLTALNGLTQEPDQHTQSQAHKQNSSQNQTRAQNQNQSEPALVKFEQEAALKSSRQELFDADAQARFAPSAKVAQRCIWKLEYAKNPEIENWIQTHMDWDGSALKQVREYKGVSVSQLSQFTKINPFYIGAIEEMESVNLPAPVFVRGYIVQICRALGINEQKIAGSYMKSYQRVCEDKKDLRI